MERTEEMAKLNRWHPLSLVALCAIYVSMVLMPGLIVMAVDALVCRAIASIGHLSMDHVWGSSVAQGVYLIALVVGGIVVVDFLSGGKLGNATKSMAQ